MTWKPESFQLFLSLLNVKSGAEICKNEKMFVFLQGFIQK